MANSSLNEVAQVQKQVCAWALTSALLVAALFLFAQEKAIAKGLVLGTCFSIINFLLLAKSIPMSLGHSRAKAGLIGFGSVLSRYLLLAIPMIVALKSESFSFVSVVIGVFAVQIVLLVDHIVVKPLWEGKRGGL